MYKFIEAVEIEHPIALRLQVVAGNTVHVGKGGGSTDFVPWLFRAKLAFDMGYLPDFLACGTCGKSVGTEVGYQFGW